MELNFRTEHGRKLWEEVKHRLENGSEQDPAHDITHIARVWETGIQLGEEQGADLEILEPALLLHDIERPNSVEAEKEHAVRSSEDAGDILDGMLPEEKIERIQHAIRAHSRSDNVEKPQTLEAKIVYDADKLDGLGPVGLVRTGLLCGRRGYSMEKTARWYRGRIQDIKENEPLYTETASEIMKKKMDVSKEFIQAVLGDGFE